VPLAVSVAVSLPVSPSPLEGFNFELQVRALLTDLTNMPSDTTKFLATATGTGSELSSESPDSPTPRPDHSACYTGTQLALAASESLATDRPRLSAARRKPACHWHIAHWQWQPDSECHWQ